MKKYSLEVVVFLCGAVGMILEIVGARILAPFVGTSIIVWTSLIGVVLASLSFGYWSGGKLADSDPDPKCLSKLIFAAGVFIALVAIYKTPLLTAIEFGLTNIYAAAVVAAASLFAVPNILLGVVSPYAVRLKTVTVQTSGSTAGNLYAISTVGSIVGTFLAGFVLLAYIGSTTILYLLASVLFFCSVLLDFQKDYRLTAAKVVLVFALLSFANYVGYLHLRNDEIVVDTQYSRVLILDRTDASGETKRYLATNPREVQSGMSLTHPEELLFDYAKFYRTARHFNPTITNALMLGGAGYTYPRDFLRQYATATIDVVEIDPGMTKVARNYFGLTDDPRLKIIHEDARVFLNHGPHQYDAIFGDAFNSYHSLPYQLTTVEAAQKIKDALTDRGVYIVNLISALGLPAGQAGGDKSKFLRAEYKTFAAVFPNVYLFPIVDSSDPNLTQNIMMVALKSPAPETFVDADPELQTYLSKHLAAQLPTDLPILTDDYAPVEQYTAALAQP